MAALREADLEDAVEDAVDSGRPFLGICVGMQMLFDSSDEDDAAVGLGIIPGSDSLARVGAAAAADAMEPADPDSSRRIRCSPACRRKPGCTSSTPCMPSRTILPLSPRPAPTAVSSTQSFRQGNVFATQFHPEKSGSWGLAMLGNFVAPRGRDRGGLMIDLYPAIDLSDGQVVRLTQGDYGDVTVYGSDPVRVACSFADAGATWIHVVDLDAARSGSPREPTRRGGHRRGGGRSRSGPDRWWCAHGGRCPPAGRRGSCPSCDGLGGRAAP